MFGVLRTNRRASHWHPNSTREIGEGTPDSSISHCSKRRKKRRREGGEKREEEAAAKRLKALLRFSYAFLLRKEPPRFFFPFPFFSPLPQISYRCTLYLPKAITNAPARTQVCSIVSRPTYRVPQPRVLPSLLCFWPL